MSDWLLLADRIADQMVPVGVVLALSILVAVIVERTIFGLQLSHRRRVEQRYAPIAQRALEGDPAAECMLIASSSRDRLIVAALLIVPLIDDRDSRRIARTREIVGAMSIMPVVDRFLRSHWWWRRALALRVLGVLQVKSYAAVIVAALDDANPQIRAAALDALADMHDRATLPALIVRMLDTSLQRGRRVAAIAAFGHECEPFLLDLARVDAENRASYARALAICGSAQARTTLCEWTRDSRTEVRAAAFEALGHVGLDQNAAALAIDGLESADVAVRAMAAYALHEWRGPGEAAPRLARHLADEWPVAVQAANSLRTMDRAGRSQLEAWSSRPDLAGQLARQMLWEAGASC
jgi:HEAT repeat protein